MAFLATGASSQSSTPNQPDLARSDSSSELLSLHQQLLASMQPTGLASTTNGLQGAQGSNAAQLQLLAHLKQQNQGLHINTSDSNLIPAQHSPNDLVQQLASQLLVNTSNPQPQAPSPTINSLHNIISSQPSLLASVLNAQAQNRQAATQQNLIQMLHQQQQKAQAQQTARLTNPANLAALLQLVQSNPLLASQILTQQRVLDDNSSTLLLNQMLSQEQARQASLSDMNQLSALLAQAGGPSSSTSNPSSATAPKPQTTYDQILKQQQDNQQSLAAAVAAVQQQQPRLNTQSSSSSLLDGSVSSTPANALSSGHQPMDVSTPPVKPVPPTSRQASSDRLLSGAESVQDHISRLISENEAIVEPNPVLLKRRPYHRQSTSNSITSQTSESVVHRESPGLFHQVPNNRLPTTRSQSMHESQMLSHVNRMNNMTSGSLTSGQPVVRTSPQQQTTWICNFCNLKFPNEAGLKAHEFRCSKKEHLQKQQSQPQLQQWHNNALLSAQQQQLLLLQQQQLQQQQQKLLLAQQQQQHQSTIAALVGGGAGVAPDLFGGSVLSGRSSVPIGSSACRALGSAGAAPSPPLTGSKNGTSSPSTSSTCSENRHPLKKRLLESVARHSSDLDLAHPGTPTSVGSSMDVQEQQQSPAKVARLDAHVTNLVPMTNVDLVKAELSPNAADLTVLETNLDPRLPYLLTLDSALAKECVEESASLKTRNITVDRNAITTTWCCAQEMEPGASNYILFSVQPVLSPEEELRFVQCLRHSPIPVRLWHYSQSGSDVGYRTTHSSYWKLVFKDSSSTLPPNIQLSIENTKPTNPSKQTPSSPDPVEEPTTSAEAIDQKKVPKQEKIERIELKPIGKERPEEVEVYVRGRGRGRYVCERCGIRCKKPSMLKKHLKSHTNVRPFSCITCNFAFKTKGNLTKHLFSKTHRVKVASSRGEPGLKEGGENGVKVLTTEAEADSNAFKLSMLESRFVNDEFDSRNDDAESDNDDDVSFNAQLPPCSAAIPYKRFGQENILLERAAHTPPTVWMRGPDDEETAWPCAKEDSARNCHSAPPACSSSTPKKLDEKADSARDTSPVYEFNQHLTNFQMNRPIEMEDAERETGLVTTSLESGGVLFPLDNLKTISNTSVGDFLATECRLFYCGQCERKFRKESDLNLHRQTHLIEQQNAKNRAYQCPECKTVQRSRAVLARHMDLAHRKSDPNEEQGEPVEGDGDGSSRKYWCGDCEVGFRTHGVLAKHFRSKSHVKTLTVQGKICDDALELIKDHGTQLANMDVTDHNRARKSLVQILDELRSESSRKVTPKETSSHQLKPAIGISEQILSAAQSQGLSLLNLRNEIKTEEEPRKHSTSENRFHLRIGQAAPYEGQLITANVWVPPRAEDRSQPLCEATIQTSNRPASPPSVHRNFEDTSEGTSRSASSTPVQKSTQQPQPPLLQCLNMPGKSTRCPICDVDKESPLHLQVHFLTEHITMREGKDLKCPQQNCNKRVSSRDLLKHHIMTHLTNDLEAGKDPTTQQPTLPSAPTTSADDSHTFSIPEWPRSEGGKPASRASPEAGIPCQMCGGRFADTELLQKHWVEEHIARLEPRPHICQQCDAGFTTPEALLAHATTHSQA